ncbi:MAG: hypothetical protein ACLQRH_26760 [Acidimicrobiales bacterium]
MSADLAVLRLLLRTSFRHRWRSWLALYLLIALVTGLVLAAAAAGRRTASAFPDYEAAHGYDGFTYSTTPQPKIAKLPEVESSTQVLLPAGTEAACDCTHATTTVALVGIVVGVPMGIAIGRGVWGVFAHSLGVLPVPVVVAWTMVAVAAGTLVVANVLALGPAAAARSRSASLLRTE